MKKVYGRMVLKVYEEGEEEQLRVSVDIENIKGESSFHGDYGIPECYEEEGIPGYKQWLEMVIPHLSLKINVKQLVSFIWSKE